MGNVIIIDDLDKRYRESKYKTIVNEYAPEEKMRHISLLETLLLQEVGNSIDFVPSCICGNVRGGWRLGRICLRCKTAVSKMSNDNLEPIAWFKSKVKSVKFISPGVYGFMDSKIIGNNKNTNNDTEKKELLCGGNKFSALKYLSTPEVRKSKDMTATDIRIVAVFENKRGFERSFKYFSRNFLKICKIIAEIKGGNSGKEMLAFIQDIEDNKYKILYTHIPIINGRLVYKTSNKITPTYNVVKNMVLGYIDQSEDEAENLYGMALTNYKSSCLYTTHVRDLIASKSGLGRKHGMSSKLDFSSRNVCIPTPSINNINEVHMPYRTSVVLFRLHIANILLKKYSARETYAKIRIAKVNFSQEIYDILCYLIDNSNLILENGKPYQGIIVGRNPGLLVGSILRLALTHIKPDITDDTMEVSTALAKLPNWDYDGDLLYSTIPLSQYVYKLGEPLSPYASVNSPKVPGRVYGKIGIGPIAPTNISKTISVERRKYGIK